MNIYKNSFENFFLLLVEQIVYFFFLKILKDLNNQIHKFIGIYPPITFFFYIFF